MNWRFRAEIAGLARAFRSFRLCSTLAALFWLCGQSAWARPTATVLTVTSAGTPVSSIAADSAVTLTATVTDGGAAVQPGQILFCDATAAYCEDIHIVGTAQLTPAGTAALTITSSPGSHSYRAVFTGTATEDTSSSAIASLTVTGGGATSVSLTASGAAGNSTLQATVTGGWPFAAGDNVSFVDTTSGNYVLGTETLGQATQQLSFTMEPAATTDSNPYAVALGDVNGDGKLDVIVADLTASTINVFLGNGDGTLGSKVATQTLGTYPKGVAVGDFNGDGKLDVVTVNAGNNTAGILLGNGDGTFQAGASFATGGDPQAVVTADLNGDGNLDLVVPNQQDNDLTILLGNGDGTFRSAPNAATGLYPISAAVGDFNGDGKPDIAVTNFYGSSVSILTGNGDGTFTPWTVLTTAGYPFSVAAADLNNDGAQDLVVACGSTPALQVFLNNGTGGFQQAASPSAGDNPRGIAVGDVNGDGIPDLVVANWQGNSVSVLTGNADGSFSAAATLSGVVQAPGVAVGDLNGDGRADVVAPQYGAQVVSTFTSTLTVSAGATVTGIAVVGTGQHTVQARFGGDPLNTASNSNTVSLTGQTVSTQLGLSAQPASGMFGTPVSVTATLTPYQAENQTTDGDTVQVLNAGAVVGTALLSGGVATLNLAQMPAGNYSLTGVFAGNANFSAATSSPVALTVSAAAPEISFSVGNRTYGDVPFAVSASSNSGGAMTYSVISGAATMSGSLVTLIGAGPVVLEAAQMAAGNYTAGSRTAAFTVSAAAPAINFSVGNHTYGDAPFAVSGSSNSGGAMTYSVISGPATVSGSLVTLTGAGPVVLEVSQAAAGNYAAGSRTAAFTVAAAVPAIGFSVGNHTYGDAPFAVSASSNSSGAMTYSVISGSATVSGTLVTVTGAGPVVLEAAQAAAGNYATGNRTAAFTAALAVPTIQFSVPNHFNGDPAFPLAATSNGPGALTYSVVSGPASISGNDLTITGVGSVTVAAAQAASANFAAASAEAVFQVAPPPFSLTAESPQVVSQGHTTEATIYFLPENGSSYNENVSLSVTGLPAGATYSFSPPEFPANAPPARISLVVNWPGAPQAAAAAGRVAVSLTLAVWWPFIRRRRGRRSLRTGFVGLLALLLAVLPWMTGCGVASEVFGPRTSYPVVVMASSPSFSQSLKLTLIVN